MCFHTQLTKTATEVQNRFNAKMETMSLFKPNENINGFEFPSTPVILDENPQIIKHCHWGLIPEWAKEVSIRKFTLNARIESIEEKPAFKNSIKKRCLVIANGFYEWQWLDSKGKNKNKFVISLNNNDLFAFAGIYSQWIDVTTNKTINTYAIVTTEANAIMGKIHNIKKRMPVILKAEDEIKWLQHQPIDNFKFPYEVKLEAKNISQYSLL
jgi:putative SOS response-associated peptidase YedK